VFECTEAGVDVLEGGNGGKSRTDKGERLRRARWTIWTSSELRDERIEFCDGLLAGKRCFEEAGRPEDADEVLERPPKVRLSSKRRSEGVRGEEEGAELEGGLGGEES